MVIIKLMRRAIIMLYIHLNRFTMSDVCNLQSQLFMCDEVI